MEYVYFNSWMLLTELMCFKGPRIGWSESQGACTFSNTSYSRRNFTYGMVFDAACLIIALVGALVLGGHYTPRGGLWSAVCRQVSLLFNPGQRNYISQITSIRVSYGYQRSYQSLHFLLYASLTQTNLLTHSTFRFPRSFCG